LFLVNSPYSNPDEIVRDVFEGYGKSWHIEEYHRHIKDQFHLENIQLRRYECLRIILMVVTISMYLLYTETRSLHHQLLTKNKIKTVAKMNV